MPPPSAQNNFKFLSHQFNQTGFPCEASCQRFIECGQTEFMLAGECDKVTIGDLIRASHQIGSDNAVGATQIIRYKLMALVGEQLTKHAKRRFRCHAVAEQRMRRYSGKSKLCHRAGGKRGNVFEPRADFVMVLVIFPEQRHKHVHVEQTGHGVRLSISWTSCDVIVPPLARMTGRPSAAVAMENFRRDNKSALPATNLATWARSFAGNSLIRSMTSAALIIQLSPEMDFRQGQIGHADSP